MKVCKFGGSSLSCSLQFEKVKNIIQKDSQRNVVIVSAPGKRSSDDNKITDLLYLTYFHIKYKVDFARVFDLVKERYLEIRDSLHLNVDLESEFASLEERMRSNKISEEELVSRGEYFNAKLMAAYLGYAFVDAKDVIFFNFDGRVNVEKTESSIKAIYALNNKIVIPGFYGCYPDGSISLFSRGGSDVTASYFAKALDATMYENWTDVSGFFKADPKIVKNAQPIKEVSYDELRELSYMGASVLHEETIIPLLGSDIPLMVLNTNHPEESGTMISSECQDKDTLITGITGKKGFISLTFVKSRTSDKLKVMLQVLKVFDHLQISVEHIPSSIDSFSVIIEKDKMEHKYFDLIAEIKKIDDVLSVKEDDDIALIAVVGRNMVTKPGISGKILSVFGQEKVNIKLIDQSREEINIIVGIGNDDFERSINMLYQQFC